jgi:hypothetical protein
MKDSYRFVHFPPHVQEHPAIHKVPPIFQVAPAFSGYDGVAMTMMLHSPKWFQKRYTVMVANILNNLPPRWAIQVLVKPRDMISYSSMM